MIRRTRALYGLLREVSLDEVREHAGRTFSIAITGSSETERTAVRSHLTRGAYNPDSFVTEHDSSEGWNSDFERASLVVYLLGSGSVDSNDIEMLKHMGKLGIPVVLVTHGSPALVGDARGLDDLNFLLENARFRMKLLRLPAEGDDDQILQAILQYLEAFDIAIARRLPVFREMVTSQLINESARANAEFALMSNLPELIPLVGNLVTAGTDLLVLTKNQVLLVFKVAAAHDADIHNSTKVLTEMIPVVGASFFWRTAARELAALIPFAMGAIPKTVIAYTGTYAAGRSAQYYYSTGRKPDRELMARFYNEALGRARKVMNMLPRLPR